MVRLAKVADAVKAALRPAVREDLSALLARAARWKPAGYDAEIGARFAYYLGEQEADVVATLRDEFPLSWQSMTPHTVRLMRKVVDARAKVFGKGTRFPLLNGQGEEVAEGSREAERWAAIQRASGLRLRLKVANRWAEALNSVVVAVSYDDRKKAPRLTVIAPQFVEVDFDEAHPGDLARARAVAIRIAGRDGLAASSKESQRWEVWTADPVQPQHFVVEGDGTVVDMPGVDGSNPYRDAEGRPVLPLVAFASQPPELGFFTTANGDLMRANRALNVTITDQHYIARCQGFGQIVISRDVSAPADSPGGEELAIGPGKAVVLKRGESAQVLNTSPQLDSLDGMAGADAKRAAVMWDVPQGAVLADSRTVASAEALIVEREPQTEAREEQVEHYRESVERLFEVMRIVNNVHAEQADRLPEDHRIAWYPGDVRLPLNPQVEQDIDLVDLANDLTTLVDILAKRRGLSATEAEEVLKRNREINGRYKGKAPAAPERGGFSSASARDKLPPDDDEEPLDGEKPGGEGEGEAGKE